MHLKFKSSNLRSNQVVILRAAFASSPSEAYGKKFPMVLDTGADLSLLPQFILDLHYPCLRGDELTIECTTGNVIQRTYMGKLYLFTGHKVFHSVMPQEGFLATDREYGLLGMDVIRDLVIILDFPNCTILRR